MTAPVVLVTGFTPFGRHQENPSADVVAAVAAAGPPVPGTELVTEVLPTSFARATARVRELVSARTPRVVLSLGLAEDRTDLSVERIGVNLMDARIPDVDGEQPVDVPVRDGGPDAHLTTIDVRAALAAAGDAGVAGHLSASAGLYVCNAVLYPVLDAARAGGGDTRAGFVHLPPVEHLSIDRAAAAVRAIVTALVPAAS